MKFVAVLQKLIPLWIFLHILISTFVMWKVTFARMIVPEVPSWSAPGAVGDRAAGIVILAIHFTLLGLFLLSAGTSWTHAIFHAPFYRPFGPQLPLHRRLLAIVAFVLNPSAGSASNRAGQMPAPPRLARRWQQADWKTSSLVYSHEFDTITLDATITCPNKCDRGLSSENCANGAAGRRDRMYHASWPKAGTFGNCCLPVWDHYCPWFLMPVYLHTIKSYLLSIWYLILFSAHVTAVMSFEASRKSPTLWRYTALPVSIMSFLVVAYVAGYWGVHQLNNLGLKNRTMHEQHTMGNVWVLVMPTVDGKWILRRTSVNPWDQGGWYANLRHVMGDGWIWLVPFWQPRRVKEYDDQRRDYDEKYGPEFMEWSNNLRQLDIEHADIRRPDDVHRRGRRVEASSSGVQEPVQPSRRRRQQTDDQV